MNSLSWLLYWADVLPSLATLVAFVSFGLLILSVFGLAFFIIDGEQTRESWKRSENVEKMTVEERRLYQYTDSARSIQKLWFCKLTAPLSLLLWGSSFLVPEKDTFYLIAGSEAGENVLKSPEITKVRQVLNNWLDKRVNGDNPK